jgi:hypothetical protein
MITNISKCSRSILLISSWHVAGALVRLKGITRYLKCSYRVLNAVFYSLPSFMRIRLYASLRSNAVKISICANRSRSSLIFSSRY